MKKIILLFLLTLSNILLFANIEMYLMRKGTKVNIALFYKNGDMPHFLKIERKSTAPLSVYRTIVTLSEEQLSSLKTDGKLLISDSYPESRQLDSYYRLVLKDNEGNIKTPPAIFLAKASKYESITFGDHNLKDESIFISEDDKNIPTFEDYDITFKVERVKLAVLITIGGGKNLNGYWFVERKTNKPLASFRQVKYISKEDLNLVKMETHVFIDKYPESRKLDAYYRLVVQTGEDERIEFPPVFLKGDAAGGK